MMPDQQTTSNTWDSCYADLHIHIGRTSRGEAVKISGSRDLTFENIAVKRQNAREFICSAS